MIEILSPSGSPKSFDQLLEKLTTEKTLMPFSDKLIQFVGEVSRSILTDISFRSYPELFALAHWFRPAQLHELKETLLHDICLKYSEIVARGLVFHIAPSNVDSVFIYSWLLSLLCGNTNVVKISRRRTKQIEMFFNVVNAVINKIEYTSIANGNVILSYDHDDIVTAKISVCCNMRVIWGGDATIKHIRTIALDPLSTEIFFANRFSLAVFNSEAVTELSESFQQELVHNFYNDAFWFNQQACSSPRTIIWIGKSEITLKAQKLFWDALLEQVKLRDPENMPSQVMDRITNLFRYACEHKKMECLALPGLFPSRIHLESISNLDRECHEGNGLFIEIYRDKLDDITSLLQPCDQTIAYFGFKRDDWLKLLPFLPPHAADRIVPVGNALAFSITWDGQNFLKSFTREIQIQGF